MRNQRSQLIVSKAHELVQYKGESPSGLLLVCMRCKLKGPVLMMCNNSQFRCAPHFELERSGWLEDREPPKSDDQYYFEDKDYNLKHFTDQELADRMIFHVTSRLDGTGAPSFRNGAWDMMVEAAMRLKGKWKQKEIGKMMKEFHDNPDAAIAGEEEAQIINFKEKQAVRLALDPSPPIGGGNWLERLPCGTTFLTTKKSMLSQPELIKAIVIAKTARSTLLWLDIPGGNAKMDLYVNTIMYSQTYELMDVL